MIITEIINYEILPIVIFTFTKRNFKALNLFKNSLKKDSSSVWVHRIVLNNLHYNHLNC